MLLIKMLESKKIFDPTAEIKERGNMRFRQVQKVRSTKSATETKALLKLYCFPPKPLELQSLLIQ